jgi:uncharacterized membrane protein
MASMRQPERPGSTPRHAEPARRPHFADESPELAGIVHRNIQALADHRRETERRMGLQERIAEAITRFAGSMAFVYLHAMLFGGWIVVNLGWLPLVRPFDPFPFVMLAMIASVEAIFLSTFVLISQNRMARLAERRADLDLQINLLAEHEVTRLIKMVDSIVNHLGIPAARPPEVEELKRDVPPEAVLDQIEEAEVSLKSTV